MKLLVIGGCGYIGTLLTRQFLDEVTEKHKSGELVDADQCYTVRWMKHLQLGIAN